MTTETEFVLTDELPKMLTDGEAALDALIEAAPEPNKSFLRDCPLSREEKIEILEEILRAKAAN